MSLLRTRVQFPPPPKYSLVKLDEIVIATGNPGKVREIGAILEGVSGKLSFLRDFPSIVMPEETGDTFAENSRIKARAVFETIGARPGRAVLADDSGLEVSGLDGRPGVRSARYAGENATDEENTDKLILEIEGVEDRRAWFVCHLTLVLPDGGEITAAGRCEGEIVPEPRGAGGFGYDPVFFLPSLGRTMAELGPQHKNSLSHRGKAVRDMAALVRKL